MTVVSLVHPWLLRVPSPSLLVTLLLVSRPLLALLPGPTSRFVLPWVRRLRSVVLASVLASSAVGLAPPAPAGRCFVPPVDAPIVDPFRMPACPYCAGNRGIEYGPSRGQAVRALAGGEVVFVGSVAGTRWVVVEHADGLLASYGRLAATGLRRGEVVVAGGRVGTTTDELYVGLRDGDRPVDPTSLIGRWRHPPRLVPLDGTPARPVGPPRLVCANGGTPR